MDSERQSRKSKKGDCLERTAFERYGSLVPGPISNLSAFLGRSVLRNGGMAETGLGRDYGVKAAKRPEYAAYTLSEND